MVFVRIASHRARSKLVQALGRLPQGYFSWQRHVEAREVTESEYLLVKNIKGITKCRETKDLRPYLDHGYHEKEQDHER
jgi:hypothetical protein